jgi:glucose-6-phosphate dehydrogenase assembly protein OpcA
VDVAAIERELARLWKPAAGDGADPSEAVTRACALTLVVYTESEREAEHASTVVSRVASGNPCRAIVVVADRNAASDDLTAWLSAHCYRPGPGSPQVCCEQITVAAHRAALPRVPGLVLALLVSDLPVVIWWLGEPVLEDALFARLADVADRVVLDSARFAEGCATLARVASAAQGRYRETAFGDLSWARLTPWRELVAQFFDPPELRACLPTIESVAIEHAAGRKGRPANQAQAALLIAWLATRLGWRTVDRKPMFGGLDCGGGLVRPDGAPVHVEVRTAPEQTDTPGELLTLRLRAAGPPRASFIIGRATERGQGGCVSTTVEVEGRGPVRRVATLARSGDEGLLAQEIESPGRDPDFDDALSLLRSLVGEHGGA